VSSYASVDGADDVPEAVVAGHVSLDVFPALQGPVKLEPGRLVVVGPAVTSTGGAVTNTGLALHRLGVGVRLIGKVGDDLFGRAVLDALAEHGEHLADDLIVSEDEATSYTIVINPPGVDRSFLHCPGANRTFSALDVPYETLEGTRLFHFGYPPLMPALYANGGVQLRDMFAQVQERGPATSLDVCQPDPEDEGGRVDWQEVLARTLPFVDVFAPSIDDLVFMLDPLARDRLLAGAEPIPVVDRALLAGFARSLTGMGACVVAIKLGAQGLYLRTTSDAARLQSFCDRLGLVADAWHDREVLSPCFEAGVVAGTTGSGDSTIAGLLAALLRGADPAGAATSATAVGACSVEAVDPTSGIPPWPRVAARLASGWRRLPVTIELGPDVTVEQDATGTMVLT
jgi:sugar/nucleoside kinase (ribokinase family)